MPANFYNTASNRRPNHNPGQVGAARTQLSQPEPFPIVNPSTYLRIILNFLSVVLSIRSQILASAPFHICELDATSSLGRDYLAARLKLRGPLYLLKLWG